MLAELTRADTMSGGVHRLRVLGEGLEGQQRAGERERPLHATRSSSWTLRGPRLIR